MALPKCGAVNLGMNQSNLKWTPEQFPKLMIPQLPNSTQAHRFTGQAGPYFEPREPKAFALHKLRPRLYKMARLVAEDELSNAEIGSALGITRQAVESWKRKPWFTQVVDQYREHFRQDIFRTGIAVKETRVKKLNKLAVKLEREIDVAAETDAPLVREYRATLEQAAKETGGAFERSAGAEVRIDSAGVTVILGGQAGGS